jgi:prepilin-type N-terminal cleavage/methylation domain-containing protein
MSSTSSAPRAHRYIAGPGAPARAEVLDSYLRGESAKSIAARHGLSIGRVHQIAREEKVSRARRVSKQTRALIHRLSRAGASNRRVARRVGFHESTVRRVLQSRSRRQRAFTLIELLIVVLIIGILVAIAAPTFLGQGAKAQDSVASQNLSIALSAAHVAAKDNTDSFPDENALATDIKATEPELGTVYVTPELSTVFATGSSPSVFVVGSPQGGNVQLADMSASGKLCVVTLSTWAQSGPTCGPAASDHYASVVLADHPDGYWILSGCINSCGEAYDYSGHGNDASVQGAVSFGQASLLTSQNTPSAYITSGQGVYVGDTIDESHHAWSMEGWLNSPYSGNRTIYAVYEYKQVGSSWETQYYVDGSLYSTASAPAPPYWPVSGDGVLIGGSTAPFNLVPGRYGEIAWYGYALSAAQIAAHYAAGT